MNSKPNRQRCSPWTTTPGSADLQNLGVYGLQPGIAAHVRTTAEEEQDIVISILRQKVGSNPKSMQACKDHIRTSTDGDSGYIRIKIARLTTKSTVKWKRVRAADGENEFEEKGARKAVVHQPPPHLQHVLSAAGNVVDAAQNHKRVPTHPLQVLQVPGVHSEDQLPMWNQVAPLPSPPHRSLGPFFQKGEGEAKMGSATQRKEGRQHQELA